MQTIKKLVASGMILSTVLSMVVVAAPTKAASATAGDLIKMSGLSAVYYLGADSKRYVFPNEATYKSWYSDFSSVKTIPTEELQSYGIGGNVTMRPGTRLVKITTNPKVYAVEPGGSLVAIPDEATAKTLYGENWAKRVSDVSDAFFINYKDTGKVLTSGVYPAGSLVKFSATDATVYYINTDGTASKIQDEAAFNANRFEFSNVMNGFSVAIPALGTPVTGAVATDITGGVNGGTYVGGSGVTVALSGSTPASASVPKNGARIPMAKVNLTAASDGAVTVNSITVKRIGLSSYSEINQVWAEKAGVIIAAKKAVSSNDEAILTFSPALTIAAGQTVTLDLLASLNSATGNVGLGIASAAAISTTGAAVSGSFPVYGNIMAPIDYNVAELTFTPNTGAKTAKVGDQKVELARFDVDFRTATASAKDIVMTSIMLKNNGVEDLSKATMNLYLEVSGTKVSDRYTVDGRYVTFYFPATGYEMLKDNGIKTFYVKGDVIAKENAGTPGLQFSLNKATDLNAYEKSTGFGVNTFSPAGTVADAQTLSAVTVTAGVVSVTKKATSPSDTTIIKGSDNTVLLANIRADEAINVDGLNIVYGSNGSNATTSNQFENVRVYVNGILVDSFDPSASTTAKLTKSIDSAFTLNKGDNEVKVMVKAKTTATPSSAFLAELQGTNSIFASKNPEYVSSKNAVAAGDISGTATGAIFTVQGAVLATVRNDGYATGKTIVKGSTDVSLGKFVLKATNDVVTVNSLSLDANTFASTTASSTLAANVYDAKVFVDGVQVGSTVDFGTSGATFSSLNFSIEKDKSKTVEVKASFDSSATGGFSTTLNVNAQDSRGTSLTGGYGVLKADTASFVIINNGTLTVALGGDTPAAAILPAKAVAQEVAQYKLTAVNDSIKVTEINVTNGVTPTTTADSIVSSIGLYDGTTLLDSEVMVSGAAKFIITNGVVVPANSSKTLSFKVMLNSIGNNNAADTDKALQIYVTTLKSKASDGSSMADTTVNTAANSFQIRKTVPTVALQTLPTTLLTAGDAVVSKFTVAADATGDVTLNEVSVDFATTTGVSFSSLPQSIKVNGTAKTATTTATASKIIVQFATPEVIAAGTSKTFEVTVTLALGGSNNSDSISTKISEDATYTTTGNFVWSDGSALVNSPLFNGKRVPGLTTASQTLSK